MAWRREGGGGEARARESASRKTMKKLRLRDLSAAHNKGCNERTRSECAPAYSAGRGAGNANGRDDIEGEEAYYTARRVPESIAAHLILFLQMGYRQRRRRHSADLKRHTYA